MTDLTQLGLCALTTGVIAYTLTQSHLFKPAREKLRTMPMAGELASCGYCLSHWIAPIFAVFISHTIFDFMVHTGSIIAGAALWMGAVDRFWGKQESENIELVQLLQEASQQIKKAA